MSTDPKTAALLASTKLVDHYSLVIESAVRNSDPVNHAGVLTALLRLRDAIAGAKS